METSYDIVRKLGIIGKSIVKTRDVQGITDHIDGYPKIYNFTVVNWSRNWVKNLVNFLN